MGKVYMEGLEFCDMVTRIDVDASTKNSADTG